jgi:DNA-binding NtrC family response regulator
MVGPLDRTCVLVALTDARARRALARALDAPGREVLTAPSLAGAEGMLERRTVDVVLSDEPLAVCARLARAGAKLEPSHLVVASGGVDVARALAAGAHAVLPLELATELGAATVDAAVRAARTRALLRNAEQAARRVDDALVGSSRRMRQLRHDVRLAASSDAPVLVVGERGSGKRLVAEQIARSGARDGGPLLVSSCDLMTDEGAVLELFGEDGRGGLMGHCDRGTLVLAELGAMPARAQAALVGHLERAASGPVTPDTRLVATSVDEPRALVSTGRLRRELALAMRLVVRVPPLRARLDDLPLLVAFFAARASRRLGRPVRRVGPETLRALREQTWPGNIAELEAVVERAVAEMPGEALLPKHVASASRAGARLFDPEASLDDDDAVEPSLGALPSLDALTALPHARAKERLLEAFEQAYLARLLHRAGGNVSEAARLAGVDRSSFRRLGARAFGTRKLSSKRPR